MDIHKGFLNQNFLGGIFKPPASKRLSLEERLRLDEFSCQAFLLEEADLPFKERSLLKVKASPESFSLVIDFEDEEELEYFSCSSANLNRLARSANRVAGEEIAYIYLLLKGEYYFSIPYSLVR